MQRLTKNERKTLKLILKNSRMPDSEIAASLKISSQAVGQIRRKLEETVIKRYTAQLDYSKLGLKTFAISISRLTQLGRDQGELEIEQALLENPNIIQVFRLPKGSSTHVIFYGFSDIDEYDNFFHSPSMYRSLHRYIEAQQIYAFSHHSLLKNNPFDLFIAQLEKQDLDPGFEEIRNFKRKIS